MPKRMVQNSRSWALLEKVIAGARVGDVRCQTWVGQRGDLLVPTTEVFRDGNA